MSVASVVGEVESWRSSTDSGATGSGRKAITASGSIPGHWKHRVRGFELTRFTLYVATGAAGRREDSGIAKVLGLGPDPIFQVSQGQPVPIGHAHIGRVEDGDGSFDYLQAEVHPGDGVFDELYSRHVYGGRMPTSIEFLIKGHADGIDDCVAIPESGRCPVMSIEFRLMSSTIA